MANKTTVNKTSRRTHAYAIHIHVSEWRLVHGIVVSVLRSSNPHDVKCHSYHHVTDASMLRIARVGREIAKVDAAKEIHG
jgi:hypothetical protein